MRRRGRPTTRGEFAKFVAKEIQKIVVGSSVHSAGSQRVLISLAQVDLPKFEYTLDKIKVLSIDVRSRETVQPRIFVEHLRAWDTIPRNASRRA